MSCPLGFRAHVGPVLLPARRRREAGRYKIVGAPTLPRNAVVHIGGGTTRWAAVARGAAERVPIVPLPWVCTSAEEEKVEEAKEANEAFERPPPPCFCVCTGMIGLTGAFRGCTGIVGLSIRKSEDEAKSEGVGRFEMAQE
jgi:hypothetical protein